jgi:predicted nuclease with TOPRIM domain
MSKKEPEAPGAQIGKLLADLNKTRDDIGNKLEYDIRLKEELQRQLLHLTDDLETCRDRLVQGKKQKKKYDASLQETEMAIQKLDETAKKLGATFEKIKK